MKFLILISFLFYATIEGKHMPKYIKTCSRNDPNINKCFMKNANLAMAHIAKGDPQYDIKTLLPLKWEDYIHIEAPTIPPFQLSLINISVFGLENFQIIKPNIDLEAKQLQFTLINPSIVWKQHYNASVEIDEFRHEIEGKSRVEFVNGEFLMTYNYDFYLNNGVQHAKITYGSAEFIDYELKFDLENLDSNKVIKKYWKKAKKYFLNNIIMEKCAATVGSYIDNIFKHVPFDLVFTP